MVNYAYIQSMNLEIIPVSAQTFTQMKVSKDVYHNAQIREREIATRSTSLPR